MSELGRPGVPSARVGTWDLGPGTSAIWLCIGASLLLRLGNSATGVLMGLLLAEVDRQRGDVPATAVGLLAASFYLAELLGAPWFGVLSDRHGPRRFMVAGPIFGGIAIQLIAWPSLILGWPLLLAGMALGRVIEGLSTASSAPSTLSFLSSETSSAPAVRGRVMAWFEMATVVGIGGGFVAGAILWDRLEHAAFVAVTAIYVASLITFVRIREPKAPVAHRRGLEPHALISVLRRPRMLRFAPAWLCVNTIVGVWATHSAFQLAGEEHAGQYLAGGFTGTSLGAGFAFFTVAFMLGVYLWGLVIGTRRKSSIMLLTLSGIYVICLSLFAVNHIGQMGGFGPAAFTVLFGVGVVVASGFTPAALAYLADLSEEAVHQRGATMGLYSVMLGLGQLLGGALGGPFADVGGVDGLILLTAILGTGALGTLMALRRDEALGLSGQRAVGTN